MKRTKVITPVGGPSIGKSVICAELFVKLKIMGFKVELVQEFAKDLVWQKDFETLNNQYLVTQTNYKKIKSMYGLVDFIIADGGIVHGLLYNRYNKDNICDVEKTELKILKWLNEFENIFIFLNRGSFEFEQEGRMHSEIESINIDSLLKDLLNEKNINFTEFDSGIENINKIIDFVVSK